MKDNLSRENSRRIKSGVKFGFIEQFGRQGLTMLVSMVMARILLPADFGLVATVAIVLVISQKVIDGGAVQSILQKANPSEDDYNTLFWVTLLVSLLIMTVLVCGAGVIVQVLKEPKMFPVVILLAINLVIMNGCRVQEVHLQRGLKFGTLATVQMISVVCGCCLGLTLAFAGYGFWALLWQQISISSLRTILLLIVVRWRPTGGLCWSSAKEMYLFGMPVVICQAARSFSANGIGLMLAGFGSADLVGFWDRGKLLPERFTNILGIAVGRNGFVVLARAFNESGQFMEIFTRSLMLLTGVAVAVLGICYIYAEDVILLLFGPRWSNSVTYFRLMCLYYMAFPLWRMCFDAMRAQGQTVDLMKAGVGLAGVEFVGASVGFFFGELHGALVGLVVGYLLGCSVTFLILLGKLDLPRLAVLKSLLFSISTASFVILIAWSIKFTLGLLGLVSLVLSGMLVAGYCLLLYRRYV